jgi:hypothetical protein
MVAARERGGEVQVEYQPAGFYCRISFLRRSEGAGLSEPGKAASLVGPAGLEPATRPL